MSKSDLYCKVQRVKIEQWRMYDLHTKNKNWTSPRMRLFDNQTWNQTGPRLRVLCR